MNDHHSDRSAADRWKQRRARHSGQRARSQRAVDARHGPQGGDQFRPGRRPETWAGTVRSSRMPRPARIITAISKASSMWCAARRACAGANICNSPLRRVPAISFSFRPMCRIRRSTPARTDLDCVLVRSDGEAIAINSTSSRSEKPEDGMWVDPIHAIRRQSRERAWRIDNATRGVSCSHPPRVVHRPNVAALTLALIRAKLRGSISRSVVSQYAFYAGSSGARA